MYNKGLSVPWWDVLWKLVPVSYLYLFLYLHLYVIIEHSSTFYLVSSHKL